MIAITSRTRVRSAALLLGVALAVGGVSGMQAERADAVGCLLGPSLGAAARAAGISCPQVDGGSGPEHWGATGGACAFGWQSNMLPPGMLDFLSGASVTRSTEALPNGDRLTRSYYRQEDSPRGSISIVTRPNNTFYMSYTVWDRLPGVAEYAFFDCSRSKDGPWYDSERRSDPKLMSAPGGAVLASSAPVGAVGSMSELNSSTTLLRVDVTNTGTTQNFADIFFDLAGYRVQSIPSLPAGMTCEPVAGLFCSVEGILPGQTLTTVIVLSNESGSPTQADIPVTVSSFGLLKIKDDIGNPATNKKVTRTNFYTVVRP